MGAPFSERSLAEGPRHFLMLKRGAENTCCQRESTSMPHFSGVEDLKRFALEHELPRRETALFGVMCPFCGKSDRIRALEPPEDLKDEMREEHRDFYSKIWNGLVDEEAILGICRFCNNILKLAEKTRKAIPLDP